MDRADACAMQSESSKPNKILVSLMITYRLSIDYSSEVDEVEEEENENEIPGCCSEETNKSYNHHKTAILHSTHSVQPEEEPNTS